MWIVFLIVTVSGLVYNIGLLANPYFERQLAGIHETIIQLEHGYNTIFTSTIFSQGQWQLLSIA